VETSSQKTILPRSLRLKPWIAPLGLLILGLLAFPLLAGEGPGFWGAGVCHRIAQRSFTVAGQQLPLCARCTGIYIGFLSAVFVSLLRGRRRPAGLPPLGIMLVLFFFLAIVGVDGVNSYLAFFPGLPHLYEPHNTLRIVTGTLEGIALAGFILPIVHMTLWQTPQEVRSIPNLRELGLILLGAGALNLLVLWHPPASLYPLALLSLLGLFLAMGMINALLAAVISGRAGRITSWNEATAILAWGTVLAMLEMAGMAWLRFLLTGSFALVL
jgi:uncharacterized membrane protein